MAVPKRKHSNHRTGIRRSHDGKSPIQLSICPECRQAVPTHVVCPNCGTYMGRKISEEEKKKNINSLHYKKTREVLFFSRFFIYLSIIPLKGS